MSKKKKLLVEEREAERFAPEPDDVESALFFENEITVKFPCDSVEREVIDLSKTGLKVLVEEEDPLISLVGTDVKILLSLKDDTMSLVVALVHQTDDEYGLQYVGCRFVGITEAQAGAIVAYLSKVNK
jgi:hypothetical protein